MGVTKKEKKERNFRFSVVTYKTRHVMDTIKDRSMATDPRFRETQRMFDNYSFAMVWLIAALTTSFGCYLLFF